METARWPGNMRYTRADDMMGTERCRRSIDQRSSRRGRHGVLCSVVFVTGITAACGNSPKDTFAAMRTRYTDETRSIRAVAQSCVGIRESRGFRNAGFPLLGGDITSPSVMGLRGGSSDSSRMGTPPWSSFAAKGGIPTHILWNHEGFERLQMVEVAGTWDGWMSRTQLSFVPGKGWSTNLPLLPGKYEYKFILDDFHWTHSEDVPKQGCAVGVFNNVIEVAARLPPPRPHPPSQTTDAAYKLTREEKILRSILEEASSAANDDSTIRANNAVDDESSLSRMPTNPPSRAGSPGRGPAPKVLSMSGRWSAAAASQTAGSSPPPSLHISASRLPASNAPPHTAGYATTTARNAGNSDVQRPAAPSEEAAAATTAAAAAAVRRDTEADAGVQRQEETAAAAAEADAAARREGRGIVYIYIYII